MGLQRRRKEDSCSGRAGAAYHEAGHAVVAEALGMRVRFVEASDNGDGRTCVGLYTYQEGKPEEAYQLLAGMLATGRRFHMSFPHIREDRQNREDYLRLREILRAANEPIDKAVREVRRHLSQRWHEVIALAEALRRQDRIEAPDVYRLLQEAAQEVAFADKDKYLNATNSTCIQCKHRIGCPAMTVKHATKISEQLRAAVDASGMSRYSICQLTGIHQSVMSRFMAGKIGLSLASIDLLADVLDLGLKPAAKACKGR